MVRRIVKAMFEYANGEIPLDDIKKALNAKENVDFGIAPPEPLILMDVQYDFDIPMDEDQIEKVRDHIKGILLDMKIQNTILEQMLTI
jgi:tRNA U38,U39,U40 pseudouridine synthase TruA